MHTPLVMNAHCLSFNKCLCGFWSLNFLLTVGIVFIYCETYSHDFTKVLAKATTVVVIHQCYDATYGKRSHIKDGYNGPVYDLHANVPCICPSISAIRMATTNSPTSIFTICICPCTLLLSKRSTKILEFDSAYNYLWGIEGVYSRIFSAVQIF